MTTEYYLLIDKYWVLLTNISFDTRTLAFAFVGRRQKRGKWKYWQGKSEYTKQIWGKDMLNLILCLNWGILHAIYEYYLSIE